MNTDAANTQMHIVSRIARDISDGLVLLDVHGIVQYVNPSASKLLGSSELKEGITYVEYMVSDTNGTNDAFHQYILDCVYEKDAIHAGDVLYTRPDGDVRNFHIDASLALSDDGMHETGVILQFTDTTEPHKAKKKHNDTIKVLVTLCAALAI